MAEKNPYINMTVEEVAHAESTFYYLQVGDETVEFQGKQTFSKQRSEYLFWELMNSLRHMVDHGEQSDQQTAILGLLHFHVHPLRIH